MQRLCSLFNPLGRRADQNRGVSSARGWFLRGRVAFDAGTGYRSLGFVGSDRGLVFGTAGRPLSNSDPNSRTIGGPVSSESKSGYGYRYLQLKTFESRTERFASSLQVSPTTAAVSIRKIGLRVAITQVDRAQILQESVMLAVAARLISMEPFDWVQRVIGTWREVSFPLNGDDLVAVGFSGPQIGRLLTEIKTWWAENRFEPDRAQCLEYLKNR